MMKTNSLVLAALALGGTALAQTTNVVSPPVAVETAGPVFHPPDVSGGVLPIRVGGGSRGGADEGVSVEVLVPDQVALTTQPQPTLYWFQSKSAETRCEVTLTQPKKAKPLLVLHSKGATTAGIHALHLAGHKIKLEPNVTYQWSVALVIDPANRSQDVVADGVIQYVPATPELTAKLAGADAIHAANAYANAGIWYDALDAISGAIAKNPGDAGLEKARASLLSQVGLDGPRIEKTALKP